MRPNESQRAARHFALVEAIGAIHEHLTPIRKKELDRLLSDVHHRHDAPVGVS